MDKAKGKKTYSQYARSRAARSSLIADCVRAFIVGGLICALGQGLFSLYSYLGAAEQDARIWVSVSLIFLTAVLTGLGIFDDIAKKAGAGTLVPITGFANSVVAPAIDNKAEGYVLGLGAKIFIIAGPVILYGTFASAVYGAIYYIVGLFV